MYLWLLTKKGFVPPPLAEEGVGRLVCSGPLIVPTPASCAAWLEQMEKDKGIAAAPTGMHQPLAAVLDETAFEVSVSAWRRQALLAGFGGGVDAGLKPILQQVAGGRFEELEVEMLKWVDAAVAQGILVVE